MSAVKTAISLEKDLFRRAEALARRMRVSRSKLFSDAMAEFIKRRENSQLLQAIDAACVDPADSTEKKLQRSWQRQHRRLVREQW
jgi:metal-responsive CopG/Arc/MetJ family transcriptional regulator